MHGWPMPREPVADPVLELAQEVLHGRRVVAMPKHICRGGWRLVIIEYRPGLAVPGLKVHMGSLPTIERRRSRRLAGIFDLGLGIGR